MMPGWEAYYNSPAPGKVPERTGWLFRVLCWLAGHVPSYWMVGDGDFDPCDRYTWCRRCGCMMFHARDSR